MWTLCLLSQTLELSAFLQPPNSLGTRSPGSCLLAGGLVPDGSCVCSSPLSTAPLQLHTVNQSFEGWRTTFMLLKVWAKSSP